MPARGMNDSGLSAAQAIFFVENKDALKKAIEEFSEAKAASVVASEKATDTIATAVDALQVVIDKEEALRLERADFEAGCTREAARLETVKVSLMNRDAELGILLSELSAERSAFNVHRDQFDEEKKELGKAANALEGAKVVVAAREAVVEEDENLLIVDRLELDDEKAALKAALGSLL